MISITPISGMTLTTLIVAAVVLAKLPWYALPALAVVPFAASLPFGERLPLWLRAVVHGAICVAAGMGAVAIAWSSAGASSSSGY